MTTDPYAAAAVLWSVVVLLVAVLIGRERSRKNRRMFDPAPMPGEAAAEPEPEATDQADIIGQPRSGFYPLGTQADFDALMADPAVPATIKYVAGVIAHQRGWCGCEPYDQDARLTGDDLDWLKSQGGER